MRPPETIDGAKVLEWAWSGDNPFGVVNSLGGNEAPVGIYGLALCRYINSNVIYRFSCDSAWETEQDSEYSSIEDAKANIPDQYRNASILWNRYEQST